MKKRIPKFPEVPELNSNQISQITKVIFINESILPKLSDIIFVFGGSHPGLWKKAYEAYTKGLGKKIITTGGRKPNVKRHPSWAYGDMSEAVVIANNLIKLGVPNEDILIEDKSIHSLENIVFGMKKINLKNIKRILFVCKSYASGRQYRTMKKNIPSDIELLPYVFDTNITGTGIITKDNWFKNEKSKSLVFGEYLRIICYGNFGHLVSIDKPIEGIENIISEYC